MPDTPLPPGSIIGILGGGQLDRMLAVAASRLGLKSHIYSDEAGAPAFDVAASTTIGSYADAAALARFAASVDVVTCEFENVPAATLEACSRVKLVFPGAKSFAVAQDRLAEKDFISRLGIEVAPYAAIDSLDQLNAALARIEPPAILKTRRLGYDGKGQVMIRNRSDAEAAWRSIGQVPAVLEGLVLFEREVSVIAVRSRSGELRTYPLAQNWHADGILSASLAPAPDSTALHATALGYARAIAERLQYVGVFALELFVVGDRLLGNEMAPRVHNSGHWTIEGAETSQFENHLRAVLGLPLGPTTPRGLSGVLNLVGATPAPEAILALGLAHLHLYGKAPRPGRKLGHVTLRADDPRELEAPRARVEPNASKSGLCRMREMTCGPTMSSSSSYLVWGRRLLRGSRSTP